MLKYFTNFGILTRLISNKGLLVVLISGISLGLSFVLGWYSASKKLDMPFISQCYNYVTHDHSKLESLFLESDSMNATLLKRVGQLEAKLLQLNLLGDRLVSMAKWDGAEFEFKPHKEEVSCSTVGSRPLLENITYLEESLSKSSQQLNALYSILQNQQALEMCAVKGRKNDIVNGWISSFYGKRNDPITGRRVWHSGVDIAGKEGEPIRCVASGMVTFSGERGGYGNCLEINHGNGLSTRYAHNKELLVEVGDIVEKGQAIALLGQSGRATGPHLHFEVRQDGQAVDPGLWFPEFRK